MNTSPRQLFLGLEVPLQMQYCLFFYYIITPINKMDMIHYLCLSGILFACYLITSFPCAGKSLQQQMREILNTARVICPFKNLVKVNISFCVSKISAALPPVGNSQMPVTSTCESCFHGRQLFKMNDMFWGLCEHHQQSQKRVVLAIHLTSVR